MQSYKPKTHNINHQFLQAAENYANAVGVRFFHDIPNDLAPDASSILMP